MRHSGIKVGLVVVGVAMCMLAVAQPKTNSPFSRFGLGDTREPNFVPGSSMGGIGAVLHHPYVTNIVNPASYAFLKATSYEIGVAGKYGILQKDDFREEVWSGNLEYISLSIPIINPINQILERKESDLSGGLNISLSPVSQVGYLVISTGQVDSIGNVNSLFRGQGGTNRLNVGTGWKYKNFAFGINLGYLFGAIEYQTLTTFPDQDYRYDHISRNEFTVRGFMYDIGGMYVRPISQSKRKNDRTVTFGMHFNTRTSFTGDDDFLNLVENGRNGDRDTAVFLLDEPIDGHLPARFGFGVMLEEINRLRVGATFTADFWSQYSNSARPETLENTWKVAVGSSYTPDAKSITSYLARVEYRGGAFYKSDPRVLGGMQANEYGFSLGMGLPFIQQRFFTYLDLSFEYGWRGVQDSLKENYLRFKLGINLNDTQWFIKRRYQ